MEIDKEKVRKLFERYDKNKNDTLEKKEFIAGFKEMLIQMAIEKWDGKLSTVTGSGANAILNIGE